MAPELVTGGTILFGLVTGSKDLFFRVKGADTITTKDCLRVTTHIVSTSNEAVSGLSAVLLLPGGEEVHLPLGITELAPGTTHNVTTLFPVGEVWGHLDVRLTFQDANGHWWSRTNGRPVKEIVSQRAQATARLSS